MKRIKLVRSNVVLSLLFVITTLSFQNCGGSFQTIGEATSEEASTADLSSTLSPVQTSNLRDRSNQPTQTASPNSTTSSNPMPPPNSSNPTPTCQANYHLQNGSCVFNQKFCWALNATSAVETWNGSSFGACQITACNQGYNLTGNTCVLQPQVLACAVANGQGVQHWNGSSYGACTLVSCNSNFTVVGQTCINSNPNHMVLAGNNPAALPGKIQIHGVGAGAFHPNKLSNWNYDERGVVLEPKPGKHRNIYAAQAVKQHDGFWNVYFGGWDGEETERDKIYLTTTADDFLNFGEHAPMILEGNFVHVNNPSVVKIGPSDWRMVYTTYDGNLNKPGFSTSTDGGNWSPSTAHTGSLLNMHGYVPWGSADVNGSNAIFRDANGLWHMYFNDYSGSSLPGIGHATSTDFVNYHYQGAFHPNRPIAPMDFKAFTYGGVNYYFLIGTANGQRVWGTVTTNLNQNNGAIRELFPNQGSQDQYIVTAGMVQDGNKIYGILYGATASSDFTQNRIFASWLQKKVIFQNSSVRWGDVERAFGPNNIRLYLADGVSSATGQFYVYDSDGTTLLYVSPTVTIQPGQLWNYQGP